MTAVDHAEMKRLAERAKERAALLRRLEALSEVADALEAMADGTCALLSEIEGLKAERDETEKRTSEYFVAMREAQTNSAVYKHDKLEAERQLASLRTQAPDSWRPIETYAGAGLVMVSTAPDSPKYLFSEPVSAFMDVGGTWRFLGSEGGMEPLPSWRQPTHWMPLPAAPALRPQTAESGK